MIVSTKAISMYSNFELKNIASDITSEDMII